jgi:phospholipase C
MSAAPAGGRDTATHAREAANMASISRRQFLTTAAGAAAATALLPACSSSAKRTAPVAPRVPGLGDPAKAPFDTVVVLTMENRSFDHLLGWFPEPGSTQAGRTYVDAGGKRHSTWHVGPDWQAWRYADPQHDWQSVAKQWNGGACDGFLRTQPVGDLYPISYYTADDLPIMASLARSYTTFDRYFCSVLGATWPNRLYMHCAASDVDETALYPYMQHSAQLPPPGIERPSKLNLAIWDRLAAKGVSGGYYYSSEPMTGLFASRRYDAISHRYEQFNADAAAGRLPNVTFLDPEYGAIPELTGTSNDDHPHGSVKVGDAFIGEVYDTLRRSPQWDRMVFVLTFDEHGGFYDHVPPPAVRDDNINPNPGPHPDYKRLGFRVPCIVMGPFAPRRLEHAGPYEHCSILRMIEWRWNLEPMHARDRYAKNLADALDLSLRRAPAAIPKVATPATVARPADAGAP